MATKRGSSAEHTKLCKDAALALNATDVCRVWINNTGGLKVDDRFVSFGLVGSSDLFGITSDGKLLGMEAKTGKSHQTKEQKQFQKMIQLMRGRYVVFRSVDQALAYVAELGLEPVDFSALA